MRRAIEMTLQVLLIDSYDSFTFNLVTLFRDLSVHPEITVVPSAHLTPAYVSSHLFPALLAKFDVIVIGPGPGTPLQEDPDMGGIPHVWHAIDKYSTGSYRWVPPVVFGVCLGFQWILLRHGHPVVRLPRPRHGLISVLDVTEEGRHDLFAGLDGKEIECVRYHSLYVQYDNKFAGNDDIVPLAWSLDENEEGQKVLMAARHKTRPYWAVQYHPESVCSKYGAEILENVFRISEEHTRLRRQWINRILEQDHLPLLKASILERQDDLESYLRDRQHRCKVLHKWPHQSAKRLEARDQQANIATPTLFQYIIDLPENVNISKFVTELCEQVFEISGVFSLLESAAAPGSWSYMGFNENIPHRFTYYIPDPFLTETSTLQPQAWTVDSIDDVWELLASVMDVNISQVIQVGCGPNNTDTRISFDQLMDTIKQSRENGYDAWPSFFGGLIGYVSYEAGVVAGLNVHVDQESPAEVPDIDMTFYTRSIAVNHKTKRVFIHTFEEQNFVTIYRSWILRVAECIEMLPEVRRAKGCPPKERGIASLSKFRDKKVPGEIRLPDKDEYLTKIDRAKEYLASGDSYELCVTDQTVIIEKDSLHDGSGDSNISFKEMRSDWAFYKRMKTTNPAPYSCFFRSKKSALIGMSPERFLRWDNNLGECELRPIKGTVKRTSKTTLEEAVAKLKTPKEQAENLMIVDLIRHDVSQFCENVEVAQLMGVETYKTVYQLVSVIKGRNMRPGVTGADILRGTLPPGSMTGAPKKRSVEILQELEGHRRRGVYSGVSGYWDIMGHGDWSVVIRSAYSVGGQGTDVERIWIIGAGGAITALSDREEEWEEMKTKLEGALRIFQDV
ncbi:ADC synthase [Lipomyces doorenjongii]